MLAYDIMAKSWINAPILAVRYEIENNEICSIYYMPVFMEIDFISGHTLINAIVYMIYVYIWFPCAQHVHQSENFFGKWAIITIVIVIVIVVVIVIVIVLLKSLLLYVYCIYASV